MKSFRISQLEIHNIGPFGDLTLAFPEKPESAKGKAEIHILTGENGTGKSTILELLAVSVVNGLSHEIEKIRVNSKEVFFKVTFTEDRFLIWNTRKSDDNVHTEKLFNDGYSEIEVLSNYHKAFLNPDKLPFGIVFFAYSGFRNLLQPQTVRIDSFYEILDHPLGSALNFQRSVNPENILKWLVRTNYQELISKNDNEKEKARKYRSAIAGIEKIIIQIIEKPFQFHFETEPLTVKIKFDDELLSFNQLPDGLKSIISWLSDLLMRMDRVKWESDISVFERNFILFLDEIEVHLHPAWQRKILPAVQSLFPNAQIFISTHSPFVIGSVDGAWIHKLVKPNGDTKLAGLPILSEDAKSVSYWLDEIFDIKSEFGQEVQKDLDKFYELLNILFVNGTEQQRKDFKKITNSLLNQNSREIETIIGFELRQLNKRISEPITL